ncbi:hypothetical protein [Nonomuraea sp. NPDC003709]|uniref:hypothetical protein n=1 Tax=Nonomuraea sp. NPDC003709 TaxID=3154450 RepID=UPI0033B3D64B
MAPLVRLRDLVSALPPPPLIPARGPPPRNHAEDREGSGQAACEETVAGHRAVLERVAREFSRTVPSRFKRNPRWSPGQKELLPDTWLEEFFAWLDPVVRSRRGLYLWF